jgi:hypothetical protein
MVKLASKGRNFTQALTDSFWHPLYSTLNYVESQNYRGYNKHDGLNSPILHALAGKTKLLRLLCIQLVTRFPVNLRPLLMVKKSVNAKGMALFSRAYLTLHELSAPFPEELKMCRAAPADNQGLLGSQAQNATHRSNGYWLRKAEHCLSWLADHSVHSHGYSGHCWGYPYDWQDVGFFAPSGMPNCVVTCFVARGFLHGYKITGEPSYLEIAKSACSFLLKDLTILYDSPDMMCISYAPVDMHWVVMDTSALAAVVLAEVSQHDDDTSLKLQARRLMNYVVDKQTDYGAWYYSHPATDSHITHDNYHTGFILDAILDYTDATKDFSFLPNYHKGIKFYQEHLFLPNGAPKWMHDKIYPHDVHGSAQGIITFSKAARFGEGYLAMAERIADWVIENLYNSREGHFYYQRGRFWTKQFTLMRWCNAWMAWAIASLLHSKRGNDGQR